MSRITAEILADSLSPMGHRLTTFKLKFPRYILAELNTHRDFSRNSASSRAIPFNTMVELVEKDPFVHVSWQKAHKGMQGSEYYTDPVVIKELTEVWLSGRDNAVKVARALNTGAYITSSGYTHEYDFNVTKQICNRLLEPFMWHTVILTSTEWENFFDQRCPRYIRVDKKDNVIYERSRKDWIKSNASQGTYIKTHPKLDDDLGWLSIDDSGADIHIQLLAEAMYDALNANLPKRLGYGEWHIPYNETIDDEELSVLISDLGLLHDVHESMLRLKICTAKIARVSFLGNSTSFKKDIDLSDKLYKDNHLSPFEHCAKVPSAVRYEMAINTSKKNAKEGWFDNFHGWQSYRNYLSTL